MTLNKLLNDRDIKTSIELLSAWIESQMAYNGLPGLSIGIIYDQKMVWSQGFGFADLENQVKVTDQTLFRIASITKLFTSTAVLQLRDAGKLDLNDAVSQYLPFKIKHHEKDKENSEIRIHHLLTHTSGLPREANYPYWTTGEFPGNEDIIAGLEGQSQALPMDRKWKYSNLALSLAGMIVSSVSGMHFEKYVQKHILEPLGMTSTFVQSVDPQHPALARGYGRRMPDLTRSIRPYGDCRGITPAANMTTCVRDLAKFVMLQFRTPGEGSQILKPSTLREMQRVHWLDDQWEAGWGWGFRIMRKGGKTYAGHGGSLMGYRTHVRFVPEDRIGVIVLTNADDGNPDMYAQKAFDWVTPPILKANKKQKEKKVDPAWDDFTGKYRSPWGDVQVLVYKDELIAIDPSEADPLESRIRLEPAGDNQFVMHEKGGFGAHGELMVFERDPQTGKIFRIKMGADYSGRIETW